MTPVLAILTSAILIASVSDAQTRIAVAQPGQTQGGRPPRDASAPLKATSQIRGHVVAADSGQPLRRAIVRLTAPGPRESRTTITDNDGRYEFKDLADGRYSLTAAKSGFVTLGYGQTRPMDSGRPLELRVNQTLQRVDFRLPRGSVITGRILDEFGEPVANARVQLMQVRYLNGKRRLVPGGGSGITWDTGDFRIWSLMPGEYAVSATLREVGGPVDSDDRSGYAPSYYAGTSNVAEAQMLKVGLGETTSGIVITLNPTRLARVSGTAIGSVGQPVSGGVVMALQRNAVASLATITSEIGPDGRFEVSGLAPGEYVLRATAAGSAALETLSATVTVDGHDVTGIIVAPVKMATVTGQITFDPPGQRPKPALIRLVVEPRNPEPMEFFPGAGSSVVGDDFRFELTAPPGEMIIRALPAGAGWVVKAVRHDNTDITDTGLELSPGDDAEGVEVVMTTRTQEVSGVVTNLKSELVSDCTVYVFTQDRRRWFAGARHTALGRPDQEGRYRLSTLPPGEYVAIAADYIDEIRRGGDPDYLEILSTKGTKFSLREGETKTLDLKVEAAP